MMCLECLEMISAQPCAEYLIARIDLEALEAAVRRARHSLEALNH